jgi:hypothetical protein
MCEIKIPKRRVIASVHLREKESMWKENEFKA